MTFRSIINRLQIFFVAAVLSSKIYAQNPAQKNQEDSTWWYITLIALAGALAITVLIWLKKKKTTPDKIVKKSASGRNSDEDDSLSFDADAEFEWMRKNRRTAARGKNKSGAQRPVRNKPVNSNRKNNFEEEIPVPLNVALLDEKEPPVFEISQLESAAKVEPLPLSNDEELLAAIEQSQDEYEENEEVRESALNVLTSFRTRNSVEALSQVAVYDLSSALRSKAVSILSEFDHESVFEGILLACADPTREVRAAAARAFSRLSFDRADAWGRVIETKEQGRMIHAARAAIEGGFVERSFDRLTHRDKKYAYEAFALVALLVEAGEIQQVLETIGSHRDMQVRRAIIHVLSVIKGENAMSILYSLLEDKQLPEELKSAINSAIAKSNVITA